jgi:hypothetical protein
MQAAPEVPLPASCARNIQSLLRVLLLEMQRLHRRGVAMIMIIPDDDDKNFGNGSDGSRWVRTRQAGYALKCISFSAVVVGIMCGFVGAIIVESRTPPTCVCATPGDKQ